MVLTHPHHSHTQVSEYLRISFLAVTQIGASIIFTINAISVGVHTLYLVLLPDQGVTYLYEDTFYILHCGRVGHNHVYHIQVIYCTPYHTSVMIVIP